MSLDTFQNPELASQIVLLCEQMEIQLPHQRKPAYYINPVIDWMTKEWKRIKPLIVNIAINSILGKPLLLEAVEELFVPKVKRRTMLGAISKVMHDFQTGAIERMTEARALSRSDTVPKLVIGQTNAVIIKLSKEGMAEVVAALEFQKDFVDDLLLSVPRRVERVLEGRYGAVSDVRANLNRAFRIDKDQVMRVFKDEVQSVAEQVIEGKITPAQFQSQMETSIRRHYGKIYREGKGTPLAKWEREFIERQVESQRQYLSNFKNFIETKKATGQELTGYVRYRAGLYAERGSALFETGHVSAMPDDILLNWTLHPAEHCFTCPIFAANSPYTKATLPGYPGEGFHLTQCGTNCRCSLDPSELYVGAGVL